MAIKGPRSGNNRRSEWTEVENVPYDGPVPSLPRFRTWQDKDGQKKVTLSPLTRRWWKEITKMPHCALWGPGEWMFAVSSALIADAFFQTSQTAAATELRNRERTMGTTPDARQRLKIRYVNAKPKLTLVEDAGDDDERDELQELYGV